MDFNLDGRFLAIGLDSETVEIWGVEDLTNYPNGILLDSLTEHDDVVSSVAFSPDGTYLVSSSDDEIVVWNTAQIGTDEDAPVRKLNTGSAQDIWDMSFSPDSSFLASVSGDIMDGEIALWSVDLFGTAGAPLITTVSYADDLTSIAFSPDGSLLASGSWNSVQVWNVSNMEMMGTFSKITSLALLDSSSTYVYTISFSPDGNRIFAAGSDGVETWSGDSDGDGYGDPTDLCSDTPFGDEVDGDGCSEGQRDDDMDGVIGVSDSCPSTPQGAIVDATGCVSVAQTEENETGENGTNTGESPNDSQPEAEGFSWIGATFHYVGEILQVSAVLIFYVVVFVFGALLLLWLNDQSDAIMNTLWTSPKKKKMLLKVLGYPNSPLPGAILSSKAIAVSDRSKKMYTEVWRAGPLDEGEEVFRIGVTREGSQDDIHHLSNALYNQYGSAYQWRGSVGEGKSGHRVARAYLRGGKLILAYMDRNEYYTMKNKYLSEEERGAPGNVGAPAPSSPGQRRFLFGKADGKILSHTFETNDRTKIKSTCEGIIEASFRFSQSGAALGSKFGTANQHQESIFTDTPRPMKEGDIAVPPSKLTWLSMQTPPEPEFRDGMLSFLVPPMQWDGPEGDEQKLDESYVTTWVPEPNHLGWLIERKGKKEAGSFTGRSGVERAWEYLVKNPDYQALRKEFKEFIDDNQRGAKVHRINARSMHGDCRAGNFVWRAAKFPGWRSGDGKRYHLIDFGNYNARGSDGTPIFRSGEVTVNGEDVVWIRPFVFGHHQSGDETEDLGLPLAIVYGERPRRAPGLRPDEYPDPLFDLAELIASLLLDIWVDPDPNISRGLDELGIDKKSGEYLLCDIWAEEKEWIDGYPQQCYYQIIKSIDLVNEWVDRIDDKNSHIVGGAEPTKEWFRYAIADRLIYRALLISSNEGCFEIGSEGKVNTPEIALRIARCIIDEAADTVFAEVIDAIRGIWSSTKDYSKGLSWKKDKPDSPPRIDARGNKGTQVNTNVEGEVTFNIREVNVGGLHNHPQSPEGSPEEDYEEDIPLELEYHMDGIDETANPENLRIGDWVYFEEGEVHYHGEILSFHHSGGIPSNVDFVMWAELRAHQHDPDAHLEEGAQHNDRHSNTSEFPVERGMVELHRLRRAWSI
jgi:hypothetical protein